MTVNICGIPHRIRLVHSPFDITMHLGQINYDTAEILLNEDAHPEIQAETLCHEILHGILVHIGKEELSQDEEFVTVLGNALYQSFAPRIKEEECYEQDTSPGMVTKA